MNKPEQQISFVQYIDGSLLQITKMLTKIAEVASTLESELMANKQTIDTLKAEIEILTSKVEANKVSKPVTKKK